MNEANQKGCGGLLDAELTSRCEKERNLITSFEVAVFSLRPPAC